MKREGALVHVVVLLLFVLFLVLLALDGQDTIGVLNLDVLFVQAGNSAVTS